MKVAIIHDFLREYGGAERVVEVLHEMFPQAPVFVAFYDEKSLGKHWQRFKDWDLRQTWFAKIPLHKKLYSPLRFLAPQAFSSLDLSDYDVVISSSNAFMAKAVKVPNGTHFCYCHTPPRSLYGYSTMSNWDKNFLIKWGGELINHYMRVKDWQVAQEVDEFLANSQETQQRIKKFYRRESTVVYPPVQVDKIRQYLKPKQKRDYYFYINRLGLQKHPDLAVQACTELNLPLKVAGTGPLLGDLKKMAGETIEFLGFVSDDELYDLYAGAKALIYPVEDEDFGMVPIEAMAAGTPVIAHKSGGPQETVIAGETGLFLQSFDKEELKAVLKSFDQQSWDRQLISQKMEKYSVEAFKQKINDLILIMPRQLAEGNKSGMRKL